MTPQPAPVAAPPPYVVVTQQPYSVGAPPSFGGYVAAHSDQQSPAFGGHATASYGYAPQFTDPTSFFSSMSVQQTSRDNNYYMDSRASSHM